MELDDHNDLDATAAVTDLVDRDVFDVDGDKVGRVVDVYLDDQSGQAEWLAIGTGLFGTKVSFAPITGSTLTDDGVRIVYSKAQVKESPRAEADGALSPDEEDLLYTHYGASGNGQRLEQGDTLVGGTADVLAGTTTTAEADTDLSTSTRGTDDGHDVSGAETDDAMTRSEEELRVSTSQQEAGRVRLRKWIETEHAQVTVPIRRERASVVVEPITDAYIDDALSGGDLTTEEHELVLNEEVIDVEKRVVPKERVRLEKAVEEDDVAVDEELRKERIDVEGGDDALGRDAAGVDDVLRR